MLHGLLQGRDPQALCTEFDKWRNHGGQVTRGVTNLSLSLPTHNTNYITKSFFYDTAKLWNKIPISIRQVKNRTTFKEKLHWIRRLPFLMPVMHLIGRQSWMNTGTGPARRGFYAPPPPLQAETIFFRCADIYSIEFQMLPEKILVTLGNIDEFRRKGPN